MRTGLFSILFTALLTVSLFFGLNAHAESGKYKAHYGWSAHGSVEEISENHQKFEGDLRGTSFNTNEKGFAHKMSVVCPTVNNIKEGVHNASGTCTMTDTEGNKINLKWSCKGAPKCEGTFTFTGGEGKYKGISGENDFYAFFITPTEGYSWWDGQYSY